MAFTLLPDTKNMKPHWMFDCQEVSILVSKSLDQKLPFLQRIALRLHLMICNVCSLNKAQLEKLNQITQLYRLEGQEDTACYHLPDAHKDKLKDVLKKNAQLYSR